MKSKFFALMALSLAASQANAGLFGIGGCDDVKIPTAEIKVFAGAKVTGPLDQNGLPTKSEPKPAMVPMVAFVTVMDHYKFTLESPDDGFWIPITKTQKIEAEYDAAKGVIRIKPNQKVKLGLMPFGPKPACKFIERVKISFNERVPSYFEKYTTGLEFKRLINFGTVNKDLYTSMNGSKEELKKLIETKTYEIHLPGQEKFVGHLTKEGQYPSWFHSGYVLVSASGVRAPLTARTLTKKETDCLDTLVDSGTAVSLYGKTLDADNAQARKLMIDDLVPEDPAFANCAK